MNQKDVPALSPEASVILEMNHISKTFGAVTALVFFDSHVGRRLAQTKAVHRRASTPFFSQTLQEGIKLDKGILPNGANIPAEIQLELLGPSLPRLNRPPLFRNASYRMSKNFVSNLPILRLIFVKRQSLDRRTRDAIRRVIIMG
jgi:hypothetical protein